MALPSDAVVLITGASSGIGAAIARACASSGRHIHLLGRSQERLAAVGETLKERGCLHWESHALDLAVPEVCDAGVRALWAFPSKHKYILDGVSCGALFGMMVAKKIPLFLLKGETSMGVSNWELVAAVLKECPELRLVYVGQGCWGEDRWFRPLMDRYGGLYTDTSRYELDGGIKAFVGRYGAERLLFGSDFPESNPGGAMLTLAHADISDEEKQMIAAGNLERLLGEVEL